VSKERARRREAREAEAAVRVQARAEADAKTAQVRARKAAWDARLRRLGLRSAGRQTGPLAQRRRTRTRLVLMALVLAQILVWIVRPDWQARLGALVIALAAIPVIAAFTL
jgi:hypothetical protein